MTAYVPHRLTIAPAVASKPIIGWLGAIGGWESVPGFRIFEPGRSGHGVSIWCRTERAAIRIVVALFEGRPELADQVLLAEDDPCFCVEDRSEELAQLVRAGRVELRRRAGSRPAQEAA